MYKRNILEQRPCYSFKNNSRYPSAFWMQFYWRENQESSSDISLEIIRKIVWIIRHNV